MDPIARSAKIKADLFTAGYVLLDVDRRHKLPLGTAFPNSLGAELAWRGGDSCCSRL